MDEEDSQRRRINQLFFEPLAVKYVYLTEKEVNAIRKLFLALLGAVVGLVLLYIYMIVYIYP